MGYRVDNYKNRMMKVYRHVLDIGWLGELKEWCRCVLLSVAMPLMVILVISVLTPILLLRVFFMGGGKNEVE